MAVGTDPRAHDAASYTKTYNKTPAETAAEVKAFDEAARKSYGRNFVEILRTFAARVGQPDPAIPTVTGLSPNTKVAGASAFVLTVNGTRFFPSSEVEWAGQRLPTTYVSATQLTAEISAALVSAAATVPVKVRTGDQLSASSNFTITAAE